MNSYLNKTFFNGMAVAMGIAVIVTNIVNPISTKDAINLLVIGVVALGLFNMQK